MGRYDTFTITSIANKDIQYELDGVEFVNDGLQRFLDACKNRITRNNQHFSICAIFYGSAVPNDGRYSAKVNLLLKKRGNLYLNEATIHNADFEFRVSARDETESKLWVDITVYSIPSADSACRITMIE